jgi:hypothetical protein
MGTDLWLSQLEPKFGREPAPLSRRASSTQPWLKLFSRHLGSRYSQSEDHSLSRSQIGLKPRGRGATLESYERKEHALKQG